MAKKIICPGCLSDMVSESVGWRCKNCRGFISLQDGKFYEYVENPFMPPMTNADRIRAMSDEELAQALYNGLDAEYCTNDPVCADLLDSDDGIPEEKCIACALRWLRQPLKENDHA